jgi:hypothetical protein
VRDNPGLDLAARAMLREVADVNAVHVLIDALEPPTTTAGHVGDDGAIGMGEGMRHLTRAVKRPA